MEFIADVQGYNVPGFVPKEVALLSRDGRKLAHFILKPPCSLQELSAKSRTNINWLFHKHHGLAWEDGFVAIEEAEGIIKKMLYNVPKLYVKGYQKKEYFRKFYDGEIDDLETEPSLKTYAQQQYCCMHTSPYVCSLNNVHVIRKKIDDKLIFEFILKSVFSNIDVGMK